MTFVGKVLVVVQLVLSVCFMAFAGAVFAVQSDWKVRAEKTQTDLDAAKKQVTSLVDEKQNVLNTMTAQLAKVNVERNNFEAEATRLNNQVKAINNDLEVVKTERDNQQALARLASIEANNRQIEAGLQRDKNKQLHEKLDVTGEELRKREDVIFGEKLRMDSFRAKHEKILIELAARREIMERRAIEMPSDLRGLDGHTPPPPDVGSQVLDVRRGRTRGGTEFVEIELGSDDGLLEGHTLYVYRTAEQNNGRAKFLGKIEIVLLTPDNAVGKVVEKAKNGVIRVGDHVTTKL